LPDLGFRAKWRDGFNALRWPDEKTDLNFVVARLGEGQIPSPNNGVRFVSEAEHVLYHTDLRAIKDCLEAGSEPPCLKKAGPREKIFFDPANLKCGIVTCGGLCPGLNNVIRAVFLRDRIKAHFSQIGRPVELKYIDPSYTIRSLPADARDSVFCLLLGQNAVHAGLAGKTNMVVGNWNHQGTHVPISLAVSHEKNWTRRVGCGTASWPARGSPGSSYEE
jgi:hypothetical protein